MVCIHPFNLIAEQCGGAGNLVSAMQQSSNIIFSQWQQCSVGRQRWTIRGHLFSQKTISSSELVVCIVAFACKTTMPQPMPLLWHICLLSFHDTNGQVRQRQKDGYRQYGTSQIEVLKVFIVLKSQESDSGEGKSDSHM